MPFFSATFKIMFSTSAIAYISRSSETIVFQVPNDLFALLDMVTRQDRRAPGHCLFYLNGSEWRGRTNASP